MDVGAKSTSSFLLTTASSKFADTKLILFYTILSIILTISLKNELFVVKYLKRKLKYLIDNRMIRGNGSKRAKLKRLTVFAKSFLTSRTMYGIRTLNKNFPMSKYGKYLTLPTQFNNKYSYERLFRMTKRKQSKTTKAANNDDFTYKPSNRSLAKKQAKIYNSRVFLFDFFSIVYKRK
jgi:hypothetical protein